MASSGASDGAKRLRLLAADVAKTTDVVFEVALRTQGFLQRRVFNDGLAADLSSIGQYRPLTKKLRAERGRQISYVDLEDTGELRRSIRTVRDGQTSTCVIVGENNVAKARDNEKRFRKPIFELSAIEQAEAVKGVELAIQAKIRSYDLG